MRNLIITLLALLTAGISGGLAMINDPDQAIGYFPGILLGLVLTPFVLFGFAGGSVRHLLLFYCLPQIIVAPLTIGFDGLVARFAAGYVWSFILCLIGHVRSRQLRERTEEAAPIS